MPSLLFKAKLKPFAFDELKVQNFFKTHKVYEMGKIKQYEERFNPAFYNHRLPSVATTLASYNSINQ